MDANTETAAEAGTERDRARREEATASAGVDATRRTVLRASAAAAGLGGAASVLATPVSAASEARDVMLTCNAKDGTVSIYDAHTYENLRTVDVYPNADPRDEVEPVVLNNFARENYIEHANVSPDGRTLYASRGHAGDVVAIDLETGEKRWETELDGVRADHQAISPDGRYLFTSDLTADKVDKIETATGAIVAEGPAPDLPHGNNYHRLPAFGDEPILVNGSLGNMMVSDSKTGDPMRHRLSFHDPGSMATLRSFSFDQGVRPFAITGDGRKAYVQISYFHGFHEYDVDENRITRTKHLPKNDHVPEQKSDYPLQAAQHGIDTSGDDEYICAAGTTEWYAAIVRRSDLELIETIPVGEHPYWVRTGPNGTHAFVAIREESEVSVINYRDAKEVARVPVGAQPHVTERATIPEALL